MEITSIQNAHFKYQKVILRVDYNVPLKNGQVSDDTRIKESLPTIELLLKNNCSIVILSHLGRPDGKRDPKLSLEPVAKKLQKLLGKKIQFDPRDLSNSLTKYCQALTPGEIVLLENIRFYPEEEKNDLKFAQKLSEMGTVYVDDAFGCVHRAHASIHAITKFLPSYAGLLLTKEIRELSKILHNRLVKPVTFVVGGAKIDTKINLIRSFASRVNHFIFGGGIANTFLAARHYQLGNSLVQKDMIKTANEISTEIHRHRKNIHLPTDFICAGKPSNLVLTKNISGPIIPQGQSILDIGKQSAQEFAEILRNSSTIIWNGPMGVIENKPFRHGTKVIAQAIVEATQNGATTILGGGDTLEALKLLHIPHHHFTHVSTGGGAMLEFLEKGTLPGIEVLQS